VPHFPSHPSVLVEQKYYCVPASAVFNRFSALWLLALSKTDIDHEGKAFCVDSRDWSGHDSAPERLTKDDLQNCFKKWQERWNKCVASQGDYFEGD
jgi:hypothetical protein